ncbi:MAG: hypothetical protein K0R02_524 [Rickettsiaceae bacterium]|jgi:hypothetical protein|nr:hypothetical protein [Rickettsiaceae bacterium]
MKNTNETDNSMIQTYIHVAKVLSAKDVNNICPILTNIKQALVQLEEKHSEEKYTQLKKEVINLFRLKADLKSNDEAASDLSMHDKYVDFAREMIMYDQKVSCPITKKLLPVMQALDNSASEMDMKESEHEIVSILRLKDFFENNVTSLDSQELNIAGAEEALQNFC